MLLTLGLGLRFRLGLGNSFVWFDVLLFKSPFCYCESRPHTILIPFPHSQREPVTNGAPYGLIFGQGMRQISILQHHSLDGSIYKLPRKCCQSIIPIPDPVFTQYLPIPIPFLPPISPSRSPSRSRFYLGPGPLLIYYCILLHEY